MNQKFFKVGSITTTHGLKGEVKVYPTTDDPKRFKRLKQVLLEEKSGFKTLNIKSVKFFKNLVILSFDEFEDINQVESLKGKSLFVDRDNALKLQKNEYYVADLIGMKVIDENDNELGSLKDVLITGANDVYAVEMNDGKELLIPAIKECILHVDIENELMRVHLLDGLLDL